MSKTRHEFSYGVVPLSKKSGTWKVLIIHHKNGNFWGFPKGHADNHEDPEKAAFRELKEETGLFVQRLLIKEPLQEKYTFQHNDFLVKKSVYYFVAEVGGELLIQQEELEEGKWFALDKAEEILTYSEGRKIFKEAKMKLQNHGFL